MFGKINSTSCAGQTFETLNMHPCIVYLMRKPLWTSLTAWSVYNKSVYIIKINSLFRVLMGKGDLALVLRRPPRTSMNVFITTFQSLLTSVCYRHIISIYHLHIPRDIFSISALNASDHIPAD